jgi:hypothetical protein
MTQIEPDPGDRLALEDPLARPRGRRRSADAASVFLDLGDGH